MSRAETFQYSVTTTDGGEHEAHAAYYVHDNDFTIFKGDDGGCIASFANSQIVGIARGPALARCVSCSAIQAEAIKAAAAVDTEAEGQAVIDEVRRRQRAKELKDARRRVRELGKDGI